MSHSFPKQKATEVESQHNLIAEQLAIWGGGEGWSSSFFWSHPFIPSRLSENCCADTQLAYGKRERALEMRHSKNINESSSSPSICPHPSCMRCLFWYCIHCESMACRITTKIPYEWHPKMATRHNASRVSLSMWKFGMKVRRNPACKSVKKKTSIPNG